MADKNVMLYDPSSKLLSLHSADSTLTLIPLLQPVPNPNDLFSFLVPQALMLTHFQIHSSGYLNYKRINVLHMCRFSLGDACISSDPLNYLQNTQTV